MRGMLGGMLMGALVSCVMATGAWATDVDVLINRLVEKGVITSSEAQEIRNEMGGKAKANDDALRAEITEVATATVPKWTQAITWSGDFRLRHEGLYYWTQPTKTTNNTVDRNRERLRLRAGLKATLAPNLETGFRLASGTAFTYGQNSTKDASGTTVYQNIYGQLSDPISTNQTFTESFDKKPVMLDWAYLKYNNSNTGWGKSLPLTILGGKFDNPYYTTSLVWDPDVTLEGLAVSATPTTGVVQWMANVGGFPVSESAAIHDPVLLAGQVGGTWSVAPTNWRPEMKALKVKANAALWWFNNIDSGYQTMNGTGYGNNLLTSKNNVVVPASHFRELNVNGEISSMLFGRPVRLYGDWVKNQKAVVSGKDNTIKDTGYLLGLNWGKTDTPGSILLGGFIEHLAADAVVGQFTDSDFGPGGANQKGPVGWISMGTLKNSVLTLKYYSTNRIYIAPGDLADYKYKRLQVDWQTKF